MRTVIILLSKKLRGEVVSVGDANQIHFFYFVWLCSSCGTEQKGLKNRTKTMDSISKVTLCRVTKMANTVMKAKINITKTVKIILIFCSNNVISNTTFLNDFWKIHHEDFQWNRRDKISKNGKH